MYCVLIHIFVNFPNFLSLSTNLCLSLHFLVAQSLKVSQWWELRVCSGHFVDIFFPCHLFRFLESPEFVGALQSLYSPNISFPSLFFPRLFVIFLTPTNTFCAKQKHLIYLLKFFFLTDNVLGATAVLGKLWDRQNKSKHLSQSFREP